MSKIFDIAHEMAKDLFEVGAMDEVTMRTVGIALFARSKGFSARGHPPHSDKKPSQSACFCFDARDWQNDRSAVGARGKKAWWSCQALIGRYRSEGHCCIKLK